MCITSLTFFGSRSFDTLTCFFKTNQAELWVTQVSRLLGVVCFVASFAHFFAVEILCALVGFVTVERWSSTAITECLACGSPCGGSTTVVLFVELQTHSNGLVGRAVGSNGEAACASVNSISSTGCGNRSTVLEANRFVTRDTQTLIARGASSGCCTSRAGRRDTGIVHTD